MLFIALLQVERFLISKISFHLSNALSGPNEKNSRIEFFESFNVECLQNAR